MNIRNITKMLTHNTWAKEIVSFVHDLFYPFLVILLLFLVLEAVIKGSITSNFNIGYLLVAVVVLGMVAVFAKPKHIGDKGRTYKWLRISFVIIISFSAAAVSWYMTSELGRLSLLISILVFMVTGFILLFIHGVDIKVINSDNLERMRRVVQPSYVQLSLIFVVLVLLKIIGRPIVGFDYEIFAYILPLFTIPIIAKVKPEVNDEYRGVVYILVIVFVFALMARLLPYIGNDIPLGYDAGLYKYVTEVYTDAMPNIPESTLPYWIKRIYPQGYPILTSNLQLVTGFTSVQVMEIIFSVIGALIVFPMFMITKRLFGVKVGLIACILYAVSYTQYSVFTLLYLKNVIGILFLLLAVYALEKRNYPLLALMYAGLGIFHRPEFLLFTLLLIPYFAKTRDKALIFSALGAAVLILPFWVIRWSANISMVTGILGTTGTFFDFAEYSQVSLAYIPFAFAGFIYLLAKKQFNIIFIYFAINFLIVVGQLFFFNRYIISLDIVMVILTAVGLSFTLLNLKSYSQTAAIAVLALVVASTGLLTVRAAREAKPLMNRDQLSAIEWLADNTEEDAYIIASSYDAPWVLGWSHKKVIAPGLFEWNKHTQKDWLDFFTAEDVDEVKPFLDEYDGLVYIYHSNNIDSYLGLKKFDNQYFEVVYEDIAIVYRYYPDGTP